MAGSNQKFGWSQRMKSFQNKQADINRLIMKYLVAEGYLDVAQGFEAVARLESETQLDPVEYQKRIRNAVRTAQVQYAIDMAKRLYPKLFESENYMYFHMQQLHLIELIRAHKMERTSNANSNTNTNSNSNSNASSSNSNSNNNCHDLAHISADQKSQSGGQLDAARLKFEQSTASMEPKMLFLVKLILWAQGKLDREGCTPRCQGFDMETDDFEFELKRALQNN